MPRMIAAISAILAFLAMSLCAGSQDPSPTAGLTTCSPQRPDPERLAADVFYLASDELEGRMAGSPGARLAAEYIADQFSFIGLVPPDLARSDYFQEFSVMADARWGENNHLEISTPDLKKEMVIGQDYATLSLSANGSAAGDVVFAGYGITETEYQWDDYAGIDAKGKIVLCLRGEPRENDPDCIFNGVNPTYCSSLRWKVLNAWNHGALALIVVTGPNNIPEGQEDRLIDIRGVPKFGQAEIPVVQVSQDAAALLWSTMDAPLGMYQAEMDRDRMPFGTVLQGIGVSLTTEVERTAQPAWNVAGILLGSDPDLAGQYVIIGAHYDHIGWGEVGSRYEGPDRQIHNGADDNASGVSGVLELARLFASAPQRPSRSILFICFSAEEIGLLGSHAYLANPLVPLDGTVAMINMDMIGRIAPGQDGVPVCTIQGTGSALEWADIVPNFTPDGAVRLIGVSNPIGGSDYINFFNAGIPALNFFSGVHEDYNMPTDDAEKINYAGMASLLGAVCEIAERTADLPAKLTFRQTENPPVEPPDEGQTGPSYSVYLGTVPDFTRTEGGFWISDVREGSPAAEGGLKGGDQIIKVGDYEVSDIQTYTAALGEYKPGDTVVIVVKRDGEELNLTVTFGSRDASR